jgi:hypothetical protein
MLDWFIQTLGEEYSLDNLPKVTDENGNIFYPEWLGFDPKTNTFKEGSIVGDIL